MDIEEKEFEDLLADKRHKEISGTLKSIALALAKNNTDPIAVAIEKQGKAIEGFVKVVTNLPKPDVSVNVEQDELISSITEMGSVILKGLSDLKKAVEEKKEWVFQVNYKDNRMDTITATQTKNKLHIN